jgi:methylenetetrahydrofolate reductase (NADPH)
MTTTKTSFLQALASGRPVLTAECVPPHSGDPEAVKRLSATLPSTLDAVVVADNPDEIHGSSLACAALLAREGRETVLSMVTRDRNRIALESDALGASALGIGAILCLSGNHQSLGVCPEAAGVSDIDSTQLEQMVKGLGMSGMAIGAVAHPHQQPLELNLLRLRKKIAAGADFLLTQPVFDLAAFTRWMDAVRAAGLDQRVAVIASVLPFTSVEHAESLRQRKTYGPVDEALVARLAGAPDAAREGLAMAAAAAAQLKTVPGVRGIHILCGGAEELAGQVIAAAGLAP